MDDLSIWVIIAQLINFWILFFGFKYFLGDKIVKAIEERRNKMQEFDDTEDKLQEKIEKAEAEADEIVSWARSKANGITEDATSLAKKNKEKIVTDAKMEADSLKNNALADIEKERLSMLDSMRSKVVDLSLKLNEKMFSSEKANKDFMEKELKTLK